MDHWTLRDWIEQDAMKRKKAMPNKSAIPKAETVDQRLARLEFENRQLHRKVAQLEEDGEILKKRRPSSRRRASEVRLHPREEG